MISHWLRFQSHRRERPSCLAESSTRFADNTHTLGRHGGGRKKVQHFSEWQNENCRRRARKQSVLRSTKVRGNNGPEPLARSECLWTRVDRVFARPTKNRAAGNDEQRWVNQIWHGLMASITADETVARLCARFTVGTGIITERKGMAWLWNAKPRSRGRKSFLILFKYVSRNYVNDHAIQCIPFHFLYRRFLAFLRAHFDRVSLNCARNFTVSCSEMQITSREKY